jgi:hypothetical protein
MYVTYNDVPYCKLSTWQQILATSFYTIESACKCPYTQWAVFDSAQLKELGVFSDDEECIYYLQKFSGNIHIKMDKARKFMDDCY